ncbi:SPW repeat domain-containing protein [Georgenia yuyongxinii]
MTTSYYPTSSQTGSTKLRAWRSWSDWTILALGAYLALAPIWTAGAPVTWFIVSGVLVAAVALWALGAASSAGSEWTQIVLGAVTFVAPWVGGFSGAAGAAWTAWILGAAVVVLASTVMSRAKRLTA